MSSSTSQIIQSLESARNRFPEAIQSVKEIVTPIAEAGGEAAGHMVTPFIPGVGMFLAPVAGQVTKQIARILNNLAFKGFEYFGDKAIGAGIDLLKATNNSPELKPAQYLPKLPSLALRG